VRSDMKLSPRQTEVLAMKAQGLTNKEVGALLFMAEKTVKTHLQGARYALDANDTLHAVVLAHRAGIINLDVVVTTEQEVAS